MSFYFMRGDTYCGNHTRLVEGMCQSNVANGYSLSVVVQHKDDRVNGLGGVCLCETIIVHSISQFQSKLRNRENTRAALSSPSVTNT